MVDRCFDNYNIGAPLKNQRKCGNCGANIPKHLKTCPFCGKKQTTTANVFKVLLIIAVVIFFKDPTYPYEHMIYLNNILGKSTNLSTNENEQMGKTPIISESNVEEAVSGIEKNEVIKETEEERSENDGLTIGQQNAVKTAERYLEYVGFSY